MRIQGAQRSLEYPGSTEEFRVSREYRRVLRIQGVQKSLEYPGSTEEFRESREYRGV